MGNTYDAQNSHAATTYDLAAMPNNGNMRTYWRPPKILRTAEVTMQQLQVVSYIHGERCWPSVEKLAPCEEACPIHQDVPSYVIAISQGKLEEARAIIRQTNPLPSVCGRVCHHPCETSCNREVVDEAVAIMWLKRLATDQEVEKRPKRAKMTRQEKVAIIGSGPAGLSAAYDLVRWGYPVTVYEGSPVAGGMLTTAIPDFILPKEIVQADIDYVRALGVDIRTTTWIRDLDYLWGRGFRAILVSAGAQKSGELKIPGADLDGVLLALPLLREGKQGEKTKLHGKVVVIGGGNVAMDVARTVLRLGANEVHVACLESRKDMPAFSWEIEVAEREGVKFHPSLAPQRFGSSDGSRVGFIDFKRVVSTQTDEHGRLTWELMEGPGSEYNMATVDSIIVAIGQGVDIGLNEKLTFNSGGGLLVDADSMLTTVSGVFAAGDVINVVGTVSESIAAGRHAAGAIDRYLKGKEPKATSAPRKEAARLEAEMVPAFLTRQPRWEMPAIPARDAIRGFGEVKTGYALWEGVEEAKRCLNCRTCSSCIFERHQLCFETATRIL